MAERGNLSCDGRAAPGLQHLTNLQAIHSIWAGIEHITKQPDYDGKTPIIRMVDEEMTGVWLNMLLVAFCITIQIGMFSPIARAVIGKNSLRMAMSVKSGF